MSKKNYFLFPVLSLLFSCASSSLIPYIPDETILRYPELDQRVSTVIGSPLVTYKIEKEYDLLVLNERSDYRICLYRGYIPRGVAVADGYLQNGSLRYNAPLGTYGGLTGRDSNDPPNYRALITAKSDSVFVFSDGCGENIELTTSVLRTRDSLSEDPEFVQELIYSGRIGDNIKLLYREYGGNVLRQAFTQELQYDISLSNILRFREVELEVIEATNQELVFRLFSHFNSIR